MSAFGLSGTNVHVVLRQPPVPAIAARNIAFVFTGEEALQPGTALTCYDADPAFRAALDRCDSAIKQLDGWSVVRMLRTGSAEQLADPRYAQPCLFAVQVALAEALNAAGITPALALGSGLGEIAAAAVTGTLDLATAARVAVLRAKALAGTPARARIGVQAPARLVQELLAVHAPQLATAAISGPGWTELTGPADTIAAVRAALQDEPECVVNALPDVHGYPGPTSCATAADLVLELGSITPTTRLIPFVSTVTPERLPAPDGEYWAANLAAPVQLWAALHPQLNKSDSIVIEIGPPSGLGEALRAAGCSATFCANLLASRSPAEKVKSLLDGHAAGSGITEGLATIGGTAVQPRPLVRPAVTVWGGDPHWLAGVRPGEQGRSTAVPAPVEVAAPVAAAVEAAAPVEVVAQLQPTLIADPPTEVALANGEDVLERVCGVVREVLGLIDGKQVPVRRPLLEQGLTSITAVELANQLAHEFDTEPDPTLVYLCPRVVDLVEKFAGAATIVAEPVEHAAVPVAPLPSSSPAQVAAQLSADVAGPASAATAIAIVGMACRLPGATGIDEFWKLLCDGRVVVGALSEHRRQRDGWAGLPDSVPTRGGYLDDIEAFDAAFFKISPMEAVRIDPQQRLFLEVAWDAIADAGIPMNSPLASRTGVYVGMNTTDYQQRLTRQSGEVDVYFGTGNCFAGTPGRLAYALNLGGPALAVDTACSSSLTAIHLARQALLSGDCDAAVVGGVNVISGPTVSVSMAHGGALAADGRCKTFAESADGYGRGEGAGVVVLKRLDRALADGDRIYATVRGSAINSDGASGGFTVPSAAAQSAVVTAALRSAGVAPSEIGYVETHGTGTALGDPIELQALSASLTCDGRSAPYIGSVKSQVGHLEAAAGITGLIKATLAVAQNRIPPHVLDGPPTSRVDWSRLGLRLADEVTAWPERSTRLAGVSAFGFTGSNAHVIVGQAPPVPPEAAEPESARVLPLVLSADTLPALRQLAAALATTLRSGTSLPEVATTLARHRSTLRMRAVVLATTTENAATNLSALAADIANPAVILAARAVTEPSPVSFRFGPGAYLGPDWSMLSGPLREAADAAVLELDTLIPMLPAETSTTQRQRLASLRAQVGWSAVWNELGLRSADISGEGAGAYAAAWLRGDLALPAAVERAGYATPSEDAQAALDGPAAVPAESERGVVVQVVPVGVSTSAAQAFVHAQLYVGGYDVDWDVSLPAARPPVALPGYPWQHRKFWFNPTSDAAVVSAGSEDAVTDTSIEQVVDFVEENPLARELRALAPSRRGDRVLQLVLAATGAVLELPAREIDPEIGFFDLGMDSIMAVALKTRVEADTHIELPATLTFELPTPRKLARHLTELLDGPITEPAAALDPGPGDPLQQNPEHGGSLQSSDQDDLSPAEPADDELLRLLSEATSSARDLLQEASQW